MERCNLVLTRKPNQSIIITDKVTGETIGLTVLWCRESKVRLSVRATKRFEIFRDELMPEAEL